MDCLYTLFKYRFSGKDIAKSGRVFDNVQRAVDFNHRNKGVDRNPNIAKKRLLRKEFKKHLFSSFQKTKTTQTSGSVFAERIKKVSKSKFEVELMKIVDWFLDGHGNNDSTLVFFRIKSFWNTKLSVTVSRSIQRIQNASWKWDSEAKISRFVWF